MNTSYLPPLLSGSTFSAERGNANRLFDLSGRVAVVTGAGGSLMSVCAAGLASCGAQVAVVDLKLESAERVAKQINDAGAQAIALACNGGNEASVEACFAEVDRAFGRVDILVNGISMGIDRIWPQDLPAEQWDAMLRSNLTSYFLCCRAAGQRMIAAQRGGSIINIASTAGASALGRGQTPYGVAKGGVLQLTRELAYSWSPHNIRVNSILPCQFVNAWWTSQLEAAEKSRMVQRVLDGIPLGRLGQPNEMIGPVLFLASDASTMVTGISLPVDGGNLALNATGSLYW
jgi:NAD(P)-dependent dehydrogenase (short-subunit alcohol dehydrogenase family)